MAAQEWKGRLETTKQEIVDINAKMDALGQAQDKAISLGDDAAAIKAKHDAKALQEQLEDLVITKAALETKLRIIKKNEPEAADIRKRIAGELWPQGTKVLSKIQQAVADLSNGIQELDQLNGTIFGLAAEHEKLIGESVSVPMISHVISQDLRQVVGIRLPELPETLELKVHSQQVREAQEKQDAIFNERMSKQKAQILPYLESANLAWPKCKTCSRELICIAGSVYAGGQQEIAGYGPEVRGKAFRLQFYCEAGNHNGPQGFIRIEGGPYETAPLTQLEIER
jgi:hypothetical protein